MWPGGGCFFHGLRNREKQGGGVTPATLQVLAYLQRTYFYPGLPTGRLLGRLAGQVVKNFFTPSKKLFERGLLCSPVGHRSFLAALAAAVSASRSGYRCFDDNAAQ